MRYNRNAPWGCALRCRTKRTFTRNTQRIRNFNHAMKEVLVLLTRAHSARDECLVVGYGAVESCVLSGLDTESKFFHLLVGYIVKIWPPQLRNLVRLR